LQRLPAHSDNSSSSGRTEQRQFASIANTATIMGNQAARLQAGLRRAAAALAAMLLHCLYLAKTMTATGVSKKIFHTLQKQAKNP
jgi:hypothetical protein